MYGFVDIPTGQGLPGGGDVHGYVDPADYSMLDYSPATPTAGERRLHVLHPILRGYGASGGC
jgi:hypothetical protein